MHPFAKKSFEFFKKNYIKNFSNPRIVDLGSMNVNGTIKDQIDFNSDYTGVDLSEGENVDVVLKDPYKLPFENNSIDIVVSISTFEHMEFFWDAFLEILRILKPNGLFLLNVPSNGPFHRHDTDNWRFYPDAGSTLTNWGKKNGFDPVLLESFTHNYSGREGTSDFVAVFLKDKKFEENYKNRILDSFKDFRNGKTNKTDQIINFKRFTQDQDNWGWKLFYKFNKILEKVKFLKNK
jgi:SAM-dependent methyltransferase|tara:strand:+ start:1110 stop:1817 length:708 start_codon:yes stop_codon:yes gene_type:complete